MVKYKHDAIGAGLGAILLAILAFLLYILVPITKEAFVIVFTGGIFLLLIIGAIALFVVAIIVLIQRKEDTKIDKKLKTDKEGV
ncbi:MAG: hypothetical protein EF806_05250 [Candidatus Methanoliparum thermophilum]|uniref:Uncharacterized protein n=1 Tax=Methanoliparum thermophilum TaxID=2491083 RepID=A0A520KQY1_METT2|nr:hypothetical protein [Candidatus Methanoliparum sp. LAM-1]RZN64028.1 MAG: hypothetical protein EF806_05250 [Candidatus Methanoliparum thermophilum]BDC35718.1 hypothetical protein MTLP_04000 [Candidatus Methanoliparum sp. LAM-1]